MAVLARPTLPPAGSRTRSQSGQFTRQLGLHSDNERKSSATRDCCWNSTPVPIVRLSDETTVLGGASNVIANLAALGARPSLVGLVGRDAEADNVRGHLSELGVGSGGLVSDRRRPTTLKTRVVSLGQQLLRLDREEGDSISAEAARRIMARFEKALRSAELVILSDYGKGVLNQRICIEIMQQIKDMPGIVGVHVMAYRQEELVAEVVHESGVLKGRSPWKKEPNLGDEAIVEAAEQTAKIIAAASPE